MNSDAISAMHDIPLISPVAIGEFSFILGALGESLGPLCDDACASMLAGASLSIVLDAFLFRLATRRSTIIVPAAA